MRDSGRAKQSRYAHRLNLLFQIVERRDCIIKIGQCLLEGSGESNVLKCIETRNCDLRWSNFAEWINFVNSIDSGGDS